MSMRIARILAVVVCGATLALIASAVVLAARNLRLDWEVLPLLVGTASAALVGVLVVIHRPFNFTLGEFTRQYAIYGLLTAPGALPFAQVMALPPYWIWYPGLILLLAFLPLYFPTGRLLSRHWKLVALFAVVATAISMGMGAVRPGDEETPGIPNPLGIAGLSPSIATMANVIILVWLSTGALSAGSLVVRFLRAKGEERQQIKWLVYAVVLNVCAALASNLFLAAFLSSAAAVIFFLVTSESLWIAIGIAILRYRLWDIDIIINCTLVYSTLTLTLALLYVGCILLLRTLVAPLTGGSELAIVASTLAIAALFTPLRRRIQNSIDKRFYRRKYDAAKVLAAFGATVRDETDLDALTGEMLRVVDETMQPQFVGLWLKETQSPENKT
jgi:hypothetical protein